MSDPTRWALVDRYLGERFLPNDAALERALEDSDAAGLPAIQVAPNQGKLLQLLARAIGARRILEIGTLGGYSAIWLGRALPPEGRMVTLESDPRHAAIAQASLARAGLADVVEVRIGKALDTLREIAAERAGPFDFVFIDADKPLTAEYFEWALRLSRRGTLIVVDNVIREGAVADPATRDENALGIRRFHERLEAEPRVSATAVQTVGVKGWDGFTMALVVAESAAAA